MYHLRLPPPPNATNEGKPFAINGTDKYTICNYTYPPDPEPYDFNYPGP